MKTRLILLLLAIAISACQRAPEPVDPEAERRRAAELQEIDQKIAELKDLERQAAERKLAETERRASESEGKAASAERERARLERERAALMADRDRLAKEQAAADERARAAQEDADAAARNAEEQTVDFFYTALEPYGDWLEVDRYGYVWQPRAASDSRWRPYTDGRWVFTDYGWFWKSNEPFGWAAYHYGRWARIRRVGWVWVPGTEWGPAWVSWRRGDRYVGWAPLPPEAWSSNGFTAAVDSYYDIGPGNYNFVAVEELSQPTYVGHVVQPEQNVTIVNNTVNVTNVTYKTVNKNVVVYNEGPDISVIAPKTAKQMPRLKVERVAQSKGGREGARPEQRGDTLVVPAPRIKQEPRDATAAKPGRVKERVKAPELERGWAGGNAQQTAQARAKVKKEAVDAEEQQRKPAKAQPATTAASPKPAPPTPAQPPKPEPKPEPKREPKPEPKVQPEPAVPSTPAPPPTTDVPPSVPAPDAGTDDKKAADRERPRRSREGPAGRMQRRQEREADVKPATTPLPAPKRESTQPTEKATPPPATPPATPPITQPQASEPASAPAEATPVRRMPKVERQRPDRPGAGKREATERPEPSRRQEDGRRARGDKSDDPM